MWFSQSISERRPTHHSCNMASCNTHWESVTTSYDQNARIEDSRTRKYSWLFFKLCTSRIAYEVAYCATNIEQPQIRGRNLNLVTSGSITQDCHRAARSPPPSDHRLKCPPSPPRAPPHPWFIWSVDHVGLRPRMDQCGLIVLIILWCLVVYTLKIYSR